MNLFPVIKRTILAVALLLTPLFFLPITQEYFVTNKVFFVAFSFLLLLTISTIEFAITREINWEQKSTDMPVLLFLLSIILSTLFASPNKVQAVLNPVFGFLAIGGIMGISYYLSRTRKNDFAYLFLPLSISGVILSLVSLIFVFNPFSKISLPSFLQFLTLRTFTPIGTLTDLLFFLGFIFLFASAYLFEKRGELRDSKGYMKGALIAAPIVSAIGIVVALGLILVTTQWLKDLVLPPWRISWYTAVEVLKTPLSLLFGAGVDNYASLFTRAKDPAYNLATTWSISTYNVARSGVLQIVSELGLFGLVAFLLLSIALLRSAFSQHGTLALRVLTIYVLTILIVFPASYIVLFLFFLTIGITSAYEKSKVSLIDLSFALPYVIATTIVSAVVVIGSIYFLGRAYAAEYMYKRSLSGLGVTGMNPYEDLRSAIRLNPRMEKYHIDFSRLNLLIANNIARKDKDKITEQDRQTIAQAIQAAIAEAKNVVALNPQRSTNWENLALIYRNIINVAQGADQWTIAAYQRAIVTDPQNPSYRLNLGGTLYTLGNYDEALKMFEQAVALKPDWPNAYYNLAWAAYQKEDFQRAALSMQNVLQLMGDKKDTEEYKKAVKDLENFKKKLTDADKTNQKKQETNTQLRLPQDNTASLSPKLKLPESAKTEAPPVTPTVGVTSTPSPQPSSLTPTAEPTSPGGP